jgi:phosphatidylglycerol---prolipoprotein diacylglyceryl transferase
MIVHRFDPALLDLGQFEIRWYSIMYIIGIIFVYFVVNRLAKQRRMKLTKQDVGDFIVYLAMGLLIGGRLGYFIFYDASVFWKDPLEILMLWHGGMSFHGGLVGTIGAGWLFCRKKRLDFWELADLVVIPVGIALMLGRLGNFINGELWGRPWNGVFCIDYTKNPHIIDPPQLCRYPSQLMEAGKNLMIFIIMWSSRNSRWPKGFRFWLFVTMYGVLRFFIEFFREPDPQYGLFFGLFSMGQILCSLMISVGATMLVLISRRKY